MFAFCLTSWILKNTPVACLPLARFTSASVSCSKVQRAVLFRFGFVIYQRWKALYVLIFGSLCFILDSSITVFYGGLTIKKLLSYPEVQSIFSSLFTASHTKLHAKNSALLSLPHVWLRHEVVSESRTNTWPGLLSLTWERYQCPLWHHNGVGSRTLCYNTLWKVEPNKEVKDGLFSYFGMSGMHVMVREHC